jgi:hypothetical protein
MPRSEIMAVQRLEGKIGEFGQKQKMTFDMENNNTEV